MIGAQIMQTLRLSANAIDLVLTSDMISKSQKFNYKNIKDFDLSAVYMAERVINSTFDSTMLNGVKKCIEFQISEITYRRKIIFEFSTKHKLFDSLSYQKFSPDQRLAIETLADSLILTIILYRIQLNDKSSGLAEAIISKIKHGFFSTCLWGAEFSKDLDPQNNKYIQKVDFNHAITFIEGYPNA